VKNLVLCFELRLLRGEEQVAVKKAPATSGLPIEVFSN